MVTQMRRVTDRDPIGIDELTRLARSRFGDMVKGVVEGPDWLEFDSMINLRPSFGNRSRGVDDPAVQEAIRRLVDRLVRR
jgi:hypothetical protein